MGCRTLTDWTTTDFHYPARCTLWMRACRQTACSCETDGGMWVDPVGVTVWTSMLKLWAYPTLYERTARPRPEVLEGHKASNLLHMSAR